MILSLLAYPTTGEQSISSAATRNKNKKGAKDMEGSLLWLPPEGNLIMDVHPPLLCPPPGDPLVFYRVGCGMGMVNM
ncbi:hypothetical protein JTE90_019547 [Oedothorax gibbosus]|uniref:Uncharacterized protein n=1 Tax=Oedothorax gibbosus TaxID=931172 RepID=A0AAV6U9D6_9ARAC|nr:hypothetical protein JTE90_019547 [Oedothorax gibbosus]